MREERRPEGARWTLGQTWPKALYGCRRRGHTLRRRERPRKPPPLAASGPHPKGCLRGAWDAARAGERAPRDRGYDSKLTRERLEELGLRFEISGKDRPAPYWATVRWVVERTSSWRNAHRKLVWCTERGEGDRLLGGVLRGGDNRQAVGPRRLDALPLGRATIPTTMSPIDGSSKKQEELFSRD